MSFKENPTPTNQRPADDGLSPPMPNGPILSAVVGSQHYLDALHHQIDLLAIELTPILGVHAPTGESRTTPAAPDCPLLESLFSVGISIEVAADRIDALRGRIRL